MTMPYNTANPVGQFQLGMPSFFSAAVFVVLLAITVLVAALLGQVDPSLGVTMGVIGVILSALVASTIKVANQWDRAIVLRLGKFQGVRGPGLFCIVPVVDRTRLVDTRVLTQDIRR
jgi:regulator of protease activity HflC (stomatin/prohibitin superfamily)